jgi:ADP-heptose:LPS heptosyltransferase
MAVARLISELGAAVILLGAPGRDRELAVQVQEFVKRQTGSTDGLHSGIDENFDNQQWPIRRILTLLRYCDLVIGPDTGPMWGVAALGVPKIMLLSHASPLNITWGWRNTATLHASPAIKCWPCHYLLDTLDQCQTPDQGNTAAGCITSISVQQIITVARQFLTEGEGAAIRESEAVDRREAAE